MRLSEIAKPELDQWYAQPEVLAKLAGWIKSKPFFRNVTRIIDPSAGDGAIQQYFPSIEMYDLDPKGENVAQADFLDSEFEYEPGTLVITNPPFGPRSRLAIEFFNRAAEFADYIAGIFPGSFQRDIIQNRMSQDFELVDQWVLPRNSFYWPDVGEERRKDVGAVAQIWARVDTPREKVQRIRTSPYFQFIPADRKDEADFAFRRNGRRAGQIILDVNAANPVSSFYIKATGDPRKLLRAFQSVDWDEIGGRVTGQKSINQADLVKAIGESLG